MTKYLWECDQIAALPQGARRSRESHTICSSLHMRYFCTFHMFVVVENSERASLRYPTSRGAFLLPRTAQTVNHIRQLQWSREQFSVIFNPHRNRLNWLTKWVDLIFIGCRKIRYGLEQLVFKSFPAFVAASSVDKASLSIDLCSILVLQPNCFGSSFTWENLWVFHALSCSHTLFGSALGKCSAFE